MATFLIVDDSAVIRRLLSHTLANHGHTIVTANNGRHALERLSETEFDLVIADLSMPEMDGVTMLKHLRADARYATLPVIILTASGTDQDRTNATIEGATGFLTKPFSSSGLIEAVNQALDQETKS